MSIAAGRWNWLFRGQDWNGSPAGVRSRPETAMYGASIVRALKKSGVIAKSWIPAQDGPGTGTATTIPTFQKFSRGSRFPRSEWTASDSYGNPGTHRIRKCERGSARAL